MSITITMYTNTSDRRRAQKALTEIAVKSCELKGDVDLLRPVLVLTGDAATYAECNYMYIEAFKRYYFCTVKSIPGGMLEITGEVDVLSSAWELGLSDLSCVMERQQDNWNLYLNDGTLKAYSNDLIQTKSWPQGFSDPKYVLIVAG